MKRNISALLITALLVHGSAVNSAAEDTDTVDALAKLGLEDLLSQEITSVLRKPQPLARAASAVYVLSNEDIRRSGARSIPEVLRLVPGITVVRSNSNAWYVTARGFDSDVTAKLLVLIDGRSVYSPLFSGVNWDVQDVVLRDVERIEVIRGPGSVSWGENAVNGVINVVTKKSSDTQGVLLSGGGGKEETAFGTARYGGSIGDATTYRVFGQGFQRDDFKETTGLSADDDWDMFHGGFRLDSHPSEAETITFQGDIYDGDSSRPIDIVRSYTPPYTERVHNDTDLSGGNALFRYTNDFSETSQLRIQTYYDRTERHQDLYGEDRDTYDIDIQHHYRISEHHDLVYGAGYRVSKDQLEDSFMFTFEDKERTDQLANAFIQDEIRIAENFSVIPGTKIGHNSYTGMEVQPAIKAVYTPDEHRAVWGSISRAARIPVRIDDDLRLNAPPTVDENGNIVAVSYFGNRDFETEYLMAYEIGYRAEPSKSFSYDIATFFHRYDNLFSVEPGLPFAENDPPPPHTIIPFTLENQLNGDAYGVELALNWRATDYLTLLAAYTYINIEMSKDDNSRFVSFKDLEGRTPHNQATLRARFDVGQKLDIDPTLYYVDATPANDVDSYIRADLRIGYEFDKQWAADFVVQDLFNEAHVESGGATKVEIERTMFGMITYTFE